jgi:transcriptional regulator with XRE-family HTH domain
MHDRDGAVGRRNGPVKAAMDQSFSAKLSFVLKALSLSRGRLAAELGVDKSAVGRWVTGAVAPSAHSLLKLTDLVAESVEGFTILDWERPLDALAAQLGVDPAATVGSRSWPLLGNLPLTLADEILDTTQRRAEAYEGFFRSTRPYAQYPGRFVHDQVMIRKDEGGLLRFDMGTGGIFVRGWVMAQQSQLFVVASEQTSGAFGFAILNGVSTRQAGALDGLVLNCSLDNGRTPTATAIVLDRRGDLGGDRAADEARFAELAALNPLAPDGSVPQAVQDHLVRDIGPTPLAAGGDWLLRMPLARSLSRGLPVV